jgi:hypothetical protein
MKAENVKALHCRYNYPTCECPARVGYIWKIIDNDQIIILPIIVNRVDIIGGVKIDRTRQHNDVNIICLPTFVVCCFQYLQNFNK